MAGPPRDQQAIFRAYVADHDTPCPGCGYNLRGLSSPRCPECNEDLTLDLKLAEPRLSSWLAAVAGAFAGVVGGGSLLIAMLILSIGEGPPPLTGWAAWLFVYLPTGAVVSCGLVGWRLLRRKSRRWFRALGRCGRAGVILGCWALTLSWFVAMLGAVVS